jgi:LacI family transcriptional regulator
MSSTAKDVSRRANVSAATVSLVLNGKPGISEDTRARVLQAAAELNYSQRPAKSAKGISSGTFRFLKIAKHGHTVNRDHNIFISDYIDGMSSEASLLGYKMEIISFDGVPIEDIASSLIGAGINGAIILGTELGEDDIRLFQAATVPIVIIDTFCDFLEFNFVNMNNKDAVYKILSYFIDCGFKRIGLIASNVQTINFHLRKAAFLEGIKKFGLSFSEKDVVTVDSTYQGAYEDMLGKLKGGISLPDCYFCTNDIITYGCIKAFREFEIRIPQDLSIIGFDNLPMSSTMDPPLTTIDVSKQKIGYLAVRLLDELIRSSEKQAAVKILVGANLIVRDSVMARAGQQD